MGPDKFNSRSKHASRASNVNVRVHVSRFPFTVPFPVILWARPFIQRQLDAPLTRAESSSSTVTSESPSLIPQISTSMVNLYVFNPANKLRLLSGLIFKTSRRLLRSVNTPLPAIPRPDIASDEPPRPKFNMKVFDLIDTDMRHVPQGGFMRDTEYYRDEKEAGLCVFLVEDTLFKVHKCYLLREPCAFGDMFSLPFVKGSYEGQYDETAIPLSDSAESFRDLLWALYASPAQLCAGTTDDLPSLNRLFNIALLANKYCIASYETWALDRLFQLAQNPNGFPRHGSPEVCARGLDIAYLCNHRPLFELITQRLIARMLWSDMNRQPILRLAEQRGFTKLQGVACYRELVDLERSQEPYKGTGGPAFISDVQDDVKRLRLLSAYHSLTNLWESICLTPPNFLYDETSCRTHSECSAAWTGLWVAAASSNQTLRHGSIDVLGKLKSMMIQLKKSMAENDSGMSMGCTLAALESITSAREDIVAGLIQHFYR